LRANTLPVMSVRAWRQIIAYSVVAGGRLSICVATDRGWHFFNDPAHAIKTPNVLL
jgi:hypothetical protein